MQRALEVFSRLLLPESDGVGSNHVPADQTASARTSHSFGCETLFEGATPIIADVVFVHGLRGHRRDTWIKDDTCWPRDLLSQEESLSRIRVITFGYDADVVNINGHASLNSLFDHSFNLLLELSRERRGDTKDRPIVFVAHSLGGIIVKDALSQSENVRDTHPHLAHIVSATRGIIFLGTPHRGSGVTSLEKVVASVAQITLRNTNVEMIRDLERNSQTLDRIRDSFRRILDCRTLTIWSFAEELAISGVERVVYGDSAIIDYSRETRGTIHADHIGMAKFSTRDDPGYKKVLYAIEMILEGHSEEVSVSPNQRILETVAHQGVMAFYDIPPIRASHFVPRNALLARLENLLERRTNAFSRSIVVLIGMGGVGKTQLTLDYCLRKKDSEIFQGIFWFDASSRNSLIRGMEIIAKRLLPGQVFDTPDDAVASIKDALSNWRDRWLIVVDNHDDPSEIPDILDLLPENRLGSILITSRYAGSKELGHAIEVDCMERTEGLQLLLQSTEEDPEELALAEKILTRLGFLPLAVDQARAYISRRRLCLRDFLDEFDSRKKNIMKETPRFWQYRRTLADNNKTSLSMLTTWEMSLSLLGVDEESRKTLVDILSLFSFFHPVSISENIFSPDDGNRILTSSPISIFFDNGHWDHLKFEDAILQMQELSLIRFSYRGSNEIVVSLHSMVSEWLRMRLDEESQSAILATAVRLLEIYLESRKHDDYTTRQEALLHIDSIYRVEEFRVKRSSFSEARLAFGLFYIDYGNLGDAERILNHTLVGNEETLGIEHMTTLKTVGYLGILYTSQGRLEDAERMYDRALSGFEKTLGPEDTLTLNTFNNLGLLYADQGRLEDAKSMYNRALAGYEKVLGTENTFTLFTVNNLGKLYDDQGHLEEAEKMYNRALAGKEKILGPEHKSTLNTVHNLGLLYAKQDRLEDAERMYDRALAGCEKGLGPEHTNTLDVVDSLGLLYADQGRLEDAERMYNRALSGYEKVLGTEHTSTLFTINSLGLIYVDQGHLEEGEKMYIRALVGKEKGLGPEHESTLNTVHNLGLLYAKQDRLEDAERMYNRALSGREKGLGPEHTSTLDVVNSLGLLYDDQGRLEDAERMYNRALSGYEKVLGTEHTSTLFTINNLGLIYVDQGHLEEGEKMYIRALVGKEKGLGPEHESTLNTVHNLGLLYAKQDRLEDAERMYDRALSGREKGLGLEHESTLETVHHFGLLYAKQGRLNDAERMYDRALSGREKGLGPEHKSTLETVHHLGLLYAKQGRLEDAERMHHRRL